MPKIDLDDLGVLLYCVHVTFRDDVAFVQNSDPPRN